MSEGRQQKGSRAAWWPWAVAAPLVYVLSVGPVLAAAFWLRELTKVDGFYAVMWFYYPLIALEPPGLLHYIEWWCELFDTVGPG